MFSVPWGFAVGREEASVTVSDAEAALRSAFKAVSDAEGAGANVSGLVLRLNEAGGRLTLAEVAYRNGDYVEAYVRADACVALANGVADDAASLKGQALAVAGEWWKTFTLSVVGSAVLVVCLGLVWVWFKGSYGRRVLRLKPEVKG
jgi:hypothetical protein